MLIWFHRLRFYGSAPSYAWEETEAQDSVIYLTTLSLLITKLRLKPKFPLSHLGSFA